MRKVYCPKHGETTDIQIKSSDGWSKPYCARCMLEFLEKNKEICVCEIKEEFENKENEDE